MPVRLDWRLGSDGGSAARSAREVEAALGDELESGFERWSEGGAPSDGPPQRRRRFRRLWNGLLLASLLLLVAGAGGFFLGQWSEAQRFIVEGVESQLELEELAWREGDRELFESTLDQRSSVEWRSALIFEFMTSAPRRWEARMIDLVPQDEGRRLQVTVEISTPGRPGETSVRFYELVGERWLRAEP